jgi:hypothetical protein
MGAVLTCLGLSYSSIKKSHDKKNASPTSANESEPQPLPSQAASQGGAQSQFVKDAQQGLTDEHLSTVRSRVEPGGESRTEIEAAGVKELQRDVATAAPLPVPTA